MKICKGDELVTGFRSHTDLELTDGGETLGVVRVLSLSTLTIESHRQTEKGSRTLIFLKQGALRIDPELQDWEPDLQVPTSRAAITTRPLTSVNDVPRDRGFDIRMGDSGAIDIWDSVASALRTLPPAITGPHRFPPRLQNQKLKTKN